MHQALNVNARVITMEHPSAREDIYPDPESHLHSKFVKRREYVLGTLLPQLGRLGFADVGLFNAVTSDMFVVSSGHVEFGGMRVRVGDGVLGNFLSNLMLWRRAAETNMPLLILEDDAFLPSSNESNVVGALAEFSGRDGVLHLLSAVPSSPTALKDFDGLEPSGGLFRVKCAADLSGSAAYAVSPNAAATLVECAERYGSSPTDGFIHRAIRFGAVELFVPQLYKQCFMLNDHFGRWNHVHGG